MKVQVLGICRFSLLVTGGFQVEHDSLDARRAMLYDPVRLAQRFVWFEHVCLPTWRAQTDPDFRLIVAIGADFPDPWLTRLRDLVEGIPQVVVEQAEPIRHRPLCRRIVQAHVDPTADVVAQFRQDDDDAVATDYVARVRGDFAALEPLWRAEGMIWADHCRGFTLMTPPDGIDVVPQVADRMTAALTVYMPPGAETCVLDYGHHKLNQVMTGVSFQDSFMYVRGKHGLNDSTKGVYAHNGAQVPCDDPVGTFRNRFAIDLEAFEKARAAL